MKLKILLLCHIITALLVSTFLWPVTSVYWDKLDLFFFHLLHDPMQGSPALQTFWALANHRWADWVEDGVFVSLFIAYIFFPSKDTKLRKTAQFLFCTLFISFIIYFVNRVIFRENLIIYRDSPSLVVDGCLYLSEKIDWLSIKDKSPKCFPADHATTALLFTCLYSYFARGWLRVIALIYGIFLCLPRMAVGAHWLSDALVGSGPIVLLFLGWALCTSFHTRVIDTFERFFCKLKAKKLRSS